MNTLYHIHLACPNQDNRIGDTILGRMTELDYVYDTYLDSISHMSS